MSTKPTPRTDAHWKDIEGSQFWRNNRTRIAMEQLERELAEALEQRDRLAEAGQVLIAAKGRHNTQQAYDGLRKALAAVKGDKS